MLASERPAFQRASLPAYLLGLSLQRRTGLLVHRQGTEQRRILQATGMTRSTIRQIERARRATELLQRGTPILQVACDLGYFDQAHLTRSLKRFVGQTPAQIVRGREQLSLLYKKREA